MTVLELKHQCCKANLSSTFTSGKGWGYLKKHGDKRRVEITFTVNKYSADTPAFEKQRSCESWYK